MAKPKGRPRKKPEQQEEIRPAHGPEVLARLLVACVRAHGFYPEGHPLGVRFFDSLRTALHDWFQETSTPLVFDVRPDCLVFADEPVRPDDQSLRRFSHRLFSLRVIRLAIEPDVGEDSLRGLVRVLARDSNIVRAGGGVAASLGAVGVSSIVVEEISPDRVLETHAGAKLSPSLDREVPGEDGAGAGAADSDYSAAVAPGLDRDLPNPAYIAKQVSRVDYGLLFSAFSRLDQHEVSAEVMQVLMELVGNSMDGQELDFVIGEFTAAVGSYSEEEVAELLRELLDFADHASSVEAKGQVIHMIAALASARIVTVLVRWWVSRHDDRARGVLRAVGDGAIGPIIERLKHEEDMKARRALVELLAEVAAENPEGLAPFIPGQPWYLLRNLADVFALIGDDRVVPDIAHLAEHEDTRVRRSALRALAGIRSEAAEAALALRLAREKDYQLLRLAVVLLGDMRAMSVADALVRVADTAPFSGDGWQVKRAAVESLGRVGGPLAREYLRRLQEGRHLLNRKQWHELRFMAAAALGALDSLEEEQGRER